MSYMKEKKIIFKTSGQMMLFKNHISKLIIIIWLLWLWKIVNLSWAEMLDN